MYADISHFNYSKCNKSTTLSVYSILDNILCISWSFNDLKCASMFTYLLFHGGALQCPSNLATFTSIVDCSCLIFLQPHKCSVWMTYDDAFSKLVDLAEKKYIQPRC